MRFLRSHQDASERLLWSRDSRLASRLAQAMPDARILELADSGWCVMAPASQLADAAVARLAGSAPYGLADVDAALPSEERYVVALGRAVQSSGIGDRIGMGATPEIANRKLLDYFFALRENHRVEFQPIVDLRTMKAGEWECLFRPHMPMLPQTIASIVDAAIVARRPVDFDAFVVDATLARIAELTAPTDGRQRRFAINLLPSSLLAPHFEAARFAERVRAAGLTPRQVIVECTEQQMADLGRLKKQVRALRRLGFGFAVDDAGSNAATFTLVAALEPSIIKIDRDIVSRIGTKNSKGQRAFVENYVAFSRLIGAKVVAEGIENRRDLEALQEREVDYGQGFLFGRSAPAPLAARPLRPRRRAAVEIASIGSQPGGWEPAVAAYRAGSR